MRGKFRVCRPQSRRLAWRSSRRPLRLTVSSRVSPPSVSGTYSPNLARSIVQNRGRKTPGAAASSRSSDHRSRSARMRLGRRRVAERPRRYLSARRMPTSAWMDPGGVCGSARCTISWTDVGAAGGKMEHVDSTALWWYSTRTRTGPTENGRDGNNWSPSPSDPSVVLSRKFEDSA